MRIIEGDMTVGDVGIPIAITTDVTLTGKNIDMVLVKQSGNSIIRDASVSGTVATYTTIAGDIDEAGRWFAYLRNVTDGYDFDRATTFTVKPKPEDMGKS